MSSHSRGHSRKPTVVGNITKSKFTKTDSVFENANQKRKAEFIENLIELSKGMRFTYMPAERYQDAWKIEITATEPLPTDFPDKVKRLDPQRRTVVKTSDGGGYTVFLQFYDPTGQYSNKRYNVHIIVVLFLIMLCFSFIYVINPGFINRLTK